MIQQTIIHLDYTQEDEISKLVPSLDILFSHQVGQDLVGLDYFRRSAGYEVPEHYCEQHGIMVSLSQLQGTERRIDGRYQLENQSVGDVALIPFQAHHWTVDAQESESILLTLPPVLVASSVAEVVNPDRIELVATFSSYYFGRLFKQSMNMTPYQYLIQCRLDEARRLLRTTDLPIAEIASRTGFSSHEHQQAIPAWYPDAVAHSI